MTIASVRPLRETAGVAAALAAPTLTVVVLTHAWFAGVLAGVLFVLRFALQPADGIPLTTGRRALLVLLAYGGLACFAWTIVVRFAHWPD